VIERHITFNVDVDKAQAFERFFADEYAPAMSQAPGFVRIDLLREADAPHRYQMSFRFQDGESAAAWRTCDEHTALQPALAALVGDREVRGYEVVT
jgi:quinol monooxygenase YgiN